MNDSRESNEPNNLVLSSFFSFLLQHIKKPQQIAEKMFSLPLYLCLCLSDTLSSNRLFIFSVPLEWITYCHSYTQYYNLMENNGTEFKPRLIIEKSNSNCNEWEWQKFKRDRNRQQLLMDTWMFQWRARGECLWNDVWMILWEEFQINLLL